MSARATYGAAWQLVLGAGTTAIGTADGGTLAGARAGELRLANQISLTFADLARVRL